jgi:hypothetical protein
VLDEREGVGEPRGYLDRGSIITFEIKRTNEMYLDQVLKAAVYISTCAILP